MGTRAIIGRVNRDGSDGWAGIYHHWDGYPYGLGRRLWELWHGHFQGDTAALTKYLIDDHPAGWSTILVCDFKQPAGFRECGVQHPGEPRREDFHGLHPFEDYYNAHAAWGAAQGPQCYCHGDRHEEPMRLETSEDTDTWCEYAYIFNEAKHVMYIFAHFRGQWYSVTSLRYNATHEDEDAYWKRLEKKVSALRDKIYAGS